MTTTREALEAAMRHSNPDQAITTLSEQGAAIATRDTMSQAIHDVYCGIMADHEHPNEKDREQADKMLAALGRLSGA
jgi:hypothetical protein